MGGQRAERADRALRRCRAGEAVAWRRCLTGRFDNHACQGLLFHCVGGSDKSPRPALNRQRSFLSGLLLEAASSGRPAKKCRWTRSAARLSSPARERAVRATPDLTEDRFHNLSGGRLGTATSPGVPQLLTALPALGPVMGAEFRAVRNPGCYRFHRTPPDGVPDAWGDRTL